LTPSVFEEDRFVFRLWTAEIQRQLAYTLRTKFSVLMFFSVFKRKNKELINESSALGYRFAVVNGYYCNEDNLRHRVETSARCSTLKRSAMMHRRLKLSVQGRPIFRGLLTENSLTEKNQIWLSFHRKTCQKSLQSQQDFFSPIC
jgi:hypothetical protein